MDLNSATGSLLGAVLVFVIFNNKEEGYPLEISTDDRCLFSPAITAGLVTRRLAWSYRHVTIPRFTTTTATTILTLILEKIQINMK